MHRFAFVLLLLAAACGGKHVQAPDALAQEPRVRPFGEQTVRLVLAEGDSVHLDTAGISLKFIGIREDTRCPANAPCLLDGHVTAIFAYRHGKEAYEFVIQSERGCRRQDCGSMVVVGDQDPVTNQVYYRFILLDVQPHHVRHHGHGEPRGPVRAILLGEMGLRKLEF